MHRSSFGITIALLVAAVTAGCSPSWAFTRTGAWANARPVGCDVRLVATLPSEPFDEIGIIDQSGQGDIRNAAEFLRSVRPHVCAAGGNAVIPRVAAWGQYMGGTVISLP